MIAEPIASVVEIPEVAPPRYPTIWGLDPIQLHDRFWAARGVFVVRPREQREIPRDAELYLLTDARTLAVFRLSPLLDILSWVRPSVMFVRLACKREQGYRESVITDQGGRFRRYQRLYGGVLPYLARVALTRDPLVADAWQRYSDSREAWKELRRQTRGKRRETVKATGRVYDRNSDRELAKLASDLVRLWKRPSATIANVNRTSSEVWVHRDATVPPGVTFVGPAWVGAGRSLDTSDMVMGPAILWDDESLRPSVGGVRWEELEPAQVLATVRTARARAHRRGPIGKRLFDIVFASIVLLFTSPLYALVIMAIWLEDGRPFFFGHRRETVGGRPFPCLKFRSMRKDAEAVKAALAKMNTADGPQFYIPDDPRLTRVGKFIRRTNIDELPQFINVLLGDMSVVGPRPSPRAENQFNPAWREARLSVRPGITGLWQVSRTRRAGMDFQEWIKYDLEYVQNMSWRLDLTIIWRTFGVLLRG